MKKFKAVVLLGATIFVLGACSQKETVKETKEKDTYVEVNDTSFNIPLSVGVSGSLNGLDGILDAEETEKNFKKAIKNKDVIELNTENGSAYQIKKPLYNRAIKIRDAYISVMNQANLEYLQKDYPEYGIKSITPNKSFTGVTVVTDKNRFKNEDPYAGIRLFLWEYAQSIQESNGINKEDINLEITFKDDNNGETIKVDHMPEEEPLIADYSRDAKLTDSNLSDEEIIKQLKEKLNTEKN
ncbi:hypothetical protein [Priestia koreensis]|uniref:hypothetical protein n=1 Tax=Priestia koreensis TaxID=284581 RepID=UPI0030164D73